MNVNGIVFGEKMEQDKPSCAVVALSERNREPFSNIFKQLKIFPLVSSPTVHSPLSDV